MKWSQEQSRPIKSDSKLNAVLACPGSGKTTVLVGRAERLLKDFSDSILVCTFSKEAAKEVAKRLPSDELIQVKTLHGLCFDLVKKHWNLLEDLIGGPGWPNYPTLVEKAQEIRLIEEIFPGKDSGELLDIIETFRALPTSPMSVVKMHDSGVWFGNVSRNELLMWVHYERERVSRGVLTFGDMVSLGGILVSLPEVSLDFTRTYRHLLIDEAQDTSEDQWKVLRPLVSSCKSTMAVGDMNQAIYGWRAADGSILTSLKETPNCVVFSLTKNYRSSDPIASVANMLLPSANIRTDKEGPPAKFDLFSSPELEVKAVMSKVTSDCAVLSRTNRYLEKYERYAIDHDMPYQGASFYRNPHMIDLYDFLRDSTGDSVMSSLTRLFLHSNYYSVKQKEDFKIVMDIIEKESIEVFLKLVDKADALPREGVTLATGHGAKGREWKTVFLVGCHPGHLPHKLTTDFKEEKNLFYVMLTRPKDHLYVSAVDSFSEFVTPEMLENETVLIP